MGKTLANCNKLSLSSSIKTCHLHVMLNLKPESFILSSHVVLKIMCVFEVSSLVKGNTQDDMNIKMLNLKCSQRCSITSL